MRTEVGGRKAGEITVGVRPREERSVVRVPGEWKRKLRGKRRICFGF